MSLIHWWPLNGDTKDYGLNPINVAQQGNAVYTSNGKIGKALTFSTTQWLQVPNGNAELSTFDHYSISCWFYLTAKSADHSATFISTGNWNSSANERTFGLYGWGTDHYTRILIPNATSWSLAIELSSADYIYLNKWYHIAISFSGVKTKLYINGKYISEQTGSKWTNTSEVSYYGIGRATYHSSFNVAGYMNDVRIYDEALSQKQISEIAKGLVLHYNFEDPYIESTTNLDSARWPNFMPASYNATYVNLSDETFKGEKIVRCTGTSASNSGFNCSGAVTISSDQTLVYSIWLRWNGTPFTFNAYNGGTDTSGTYRDPLVSWTLNNAWNGSRTVYGVTESIEIYDVTNNEVLWSNVLANRWYRFVIILKNTNSASVTISNFYFLGGANTCTWDYSCPQKEFKNHATPYVRSSRNADLICDCSGYSRHATLTNNNYSITANSMTGNYALTTSGATFTHQCPLGQRGTDQEWTVNAWIYPTAIVAGSTKLNTFNVGNYINGNTSNSRALLYLNSGTNDYYTYSNTAVPLNQWTMITYVFRNSDGLRKIYYNGVLDDVGGPNKTSTPSGLSETITCLQNFTGSIADYKIYATALTADQIKNEYESKASIDRNGKLFSSKFLEAAGNKEITKSSIIKTSEPIELLHYNNAYWLPIMMHNNHGGTNMFSSSDDFTKTVYHNSDCWAMFQMIPTYQSGGVFEFLAIQHESTASGTLTGQVNKYRWTQTADPTISTSPGTVISIEGTCPGLVKCNGATYMARTSTTSNWWWAAGAWTTHQYGTPGWGNISTADLQQLFIRVPDQDPVKLMKNEFIIANEFIER